MNFNEILETSIIKCYIKLIFILEQVTHVLSDVQMFTHPCLILICCSRFSINVLRLIKIYFN